MSDSPSNASEPAPLGPPAEVRAYISDMLADLADMAGRLGDRRLEYSLRLLALDAATALR